MKDKTGFTIPENILTEWKRADDVGRELVAVLTQIINEVEALIKAKDPIVAEIHDVVDAHNARTALRQVIPYAVCPSCEGKDRETCRWCRQRGFMSKWHYHNCIPAELRESRVNQLQDA